MPQVRQTSTRVQMVGEADHAAIDNGGADSFAFTSQPLHSSLLSLPSISPTMDFDAFSEDEIELKSLEKAIAISEKEVTLLPSPQVSTPASASGQVSSGGSGVSKGGGGGKRDPQRWSDEEHILFLKGLAMHGRSWKMIGEVVKTRTVVQIRTHAQKYLIKLEKAKRAGHQGLLMMDGKFPNNHELATAAAADRGGGGRRGGGARKAKGGKGGGGRGIKNKKSSPLSTSSHNHSGSREGGLSSHPSSTSLNSNATIQSLAASSSTSSLSSIPTIKPSSAAAAATAHRSSFDLLGSNSSRSAFARRWAWNGPTKSTSSSLSLCSSSSSSSSSSSPADPIPDPSSSPMRVATTITTQSHRKQQPQPRESNMYASPPVHGERNPDPPKYTSAAASSTTSKPALSLTIDPLLRPLPLLKGKVSSFQQQQQQQQPHNHHSLRSSSSSSHRACVRPLHHPPSTSIAGTKGEGSSSSSSTAAAAAPTTTKHQGTACQMQMHTHSDQRLGGQATGFTGSHFSSTTCTTGLSFALLPTLSADSQARLRALNLPLPRGPEGIICPFGVLRDMDLRLHANEYPGIMYPAAKCKILSPTAKPAVRLPIDELHCFAADDAAHMSSSSTLSSFINPDTEDYTQQGRLKRQRVTTTTTTHHHHAVPLDRSSYCGPLSNTHSQQASSHPSLNNYNKNPIDELLQSLEEAYSSETAVDELAAMEDLSAWEVAHSATNHRHRTRSWDIVDEIETMSMDDVAWLEVTPSFASTLPSSSPTKVITSSSPTSSSSATSFDNNSVAGGAVGTYHHSKSTPISSIYFDEGAAASCVGAA